MLGFETIGNATIIAYDGTPIVATDPWINGDAYFGSWGVSHEIPPAQLAAIKACKYYWVSHGHPDHLNLSSITALSDKEILLADHRGARIRDDLSGMGFRVRILPERTWVSLSPHVRVLTLSDYNQDSILLIDVGGRLLVNLNDASDHGWGRFVKSVAAQYKQSYLLRLWGYGDADMNNFFTESGERIIRASRPRRLPLGRTIQTDALRFGTQYAIPFSSFHRYQREDSIWANGLTVPMENYTAGQQPNLPQVLPAFLRVDAVTGHIEEIAPRRLDHQVRKPEDFGDNWSDRLTLEEKQAVGSYFLSKEIVRQRFGFLRFRVGGEEFTIDLNKTQRDNGITFEVPRQSLVTAVKYRVFDDLLIGNFMKTTLHGQASLYPDFAPYVAKYADNGKAESKEELRDYFHHYRRRDPIGYIFRTLESDSEELFRKFVPHDSLVFRTAKVLYWKLIA
jgi:hypothetical protein